jgi:hypothetical protein
MLTIGIRYCGGCNPQIDRSRIVMEVSEGFKKMGREVDLITEKYRSVDVVLLINGCQHACLEEAHLESSLRQQVISVRGEMVDDQHVEENDIPKLLIQRIGSSLTPEITSQSPFDKRGARRDFHGSWGSPAS